MVNVIDETAVETVNTKVEKAATPKKGNASWKAPTGETLMKEKGYGYRWTAESEIPGRLQEGWTLVTAKHGETTYVDGKDKIFGGTRLDSVVAKRDRVLMRMPDEMIEQRNAHYNQRAENQVMAIKQRASEQAGETLHGEIKIENRGPVRTIID